MVTPNAEHDCARCPVAREAAKLQRMILSDAHVDSMTWLTRCRQTVETFNRCLHQHLGFDAAMCVHEQVLATAPQCAGQVRELEGQHQRLLAESDALLVQVRDLVEFSHGEARDITRQMENLLALFQRHEGAEVRLVREVLGAGAAVPDTSRRPCAFHHGPTDPGMDLDAKPNG